MKPLSRLSRFVTALVSVVALLFGGITSAQQVTFDIPELVVNTSFLNVRTGPGIEYSVLVTVVGGTELPVLGTIGDGVWYQVNTDGGPGWVNISFTLPRGDFSNVPILEVGETGAPNVNLGAGGGATAPAMSATSGIMGGDFIQGVTSIGRNLRAQPDFNSLIINSSMPNDPNTVYPLIQTTTGADGATWYYFQIPGIGTGWTDTVDFRLLECEADVVRTVTSPTPIRFDGIENRDSFLLDFDTEVYVLGRQNQFAVVQLQDRSIGLVDPEVLVDRTGVNNVCNGLNTARMGGTAAGTNPGQGGGEVGAAPSMPVPQLTGNRVVVNTGFLNIRSGPAAGFSVVATVPGGTELIVLGRAPDAVWYLVEGAFGRGWLNSQFTVFRGNFSSVPVLTEPVIIDTQQVGSNPGQGGGVATPMTVQSGTQVTGAALLGKDMHEQPDYDSIIVNSSVPNDPSTVYPLLATQENNGTTWYFVSIPNIGTGWMDNVLLRPLECGMDAVGRARGSVPIRFDGIANRTSFLLEPFTEFYIVGRQGEFAIVQLVDGTVGLVNATDVQQREGVESVCIGIAEPVSANTMGAPANTSAPTTPVVTQPQVTGNRLIVNTGNLNVRSGPNAGFSVVATVPGASELTVIGRTADGVWYYIEGNFGRGWVNSQFTVFRGNFSTVPVIDLGDI